MKVNVTQNSMVYGEISPTLYGQRSLDQYAGGLKKLENFIVRPQGGVFRREGTQWQFNLPNVPNPIPAGHTYRCIPYSFTDYTGKSRQIIFILQHGFITAWEESSTGSIDPARFSRYNPNDPDNISLTDEPYWVNICNVSTGSTDAPREIVFNGDQKGTLLATRFPAESGAPAAGYEFASIDSIPFGHGSGPYYIPAPAELGFGSVGLGEAENIHLATAEMGPFWTVVQTLTHQFNNGAGGVSQGIMAGVTDARGPVYMALSSQPVYPTQTGKYPNDVDPGVLVDGDWPGLTYASADPDARYPLLPWWKHGTHGDNTAIASEGQWFKDFRRSISVDGSIIAEEPDFCKASYGEKVRYVQDNNTLWITLSPNVIAKIEYRAWNSRYGLQQLPIASDPGNRVAHDLVLDLYPLGVNGPFKYDDSGSVKLAGDFNEPAQANAYTISSYDAVGNDPMDNDLRKPLAQGTLSTDSVLHGGGVDNLLHMGYSTGDDLSHSYQTGGALPEDGSGRDGGLRNFEHWNPFSANPVQYFENVWPTEDVTGFTVMIGNTAGSPFAPASQWAELARLVQHPGSTWGDGTNHLMSTAYNGAEIPPGFPGAGTPIYEHLVNQVQLTHPQRWYNEATPTLPGTIAELPIQMTVSLEMPYDEEWSFGGGSPGWGRVVPTDGKNLINASASGKPWNRTTLEAAHGGNIGGYWVDVGKIAIQRDLSNYTRSEFPIGWDYALPKGLDGGGSVSAPDTGYGFGAHFSGLDYFTFTVDQAFTNAATGGDPGGVNVGNVTKIIKGTTFYLAWRVGGLGIPPTDDAYVHADADPEGDGGPYDLADGKSLTIEKYPYEAVMPWKTDLKAYSGTTSSTAKWHGDPWYSTVYTHPWAVPHILQSSSTEQKGGYGTVSLIDTVPGPAPPTGESNRQTDWVHLAWDTDNPVTRRGQTVLRPSKSTQAGDLPRDTVYTAWGSVFGRALDLEDETYLAMARFQDRIVIAGGLDPRIAFCSASNSIAEPRFIPWDYDGTLDSPVAAFKILLDRLESDITNIFSIENDIFIGTRDRLWKVFGPDANAAFAVTNIYSQPISDKGTNTIQPALSEDSAIYCAPDGNSLHRLTFGGQDEGYTLDEMSIYSNHFFQKGGGIRRMVSSLAPQNMIWIQTGIGNLVAYTLNRRQSVQGGSTHVLGTNSKGSQIMDIASYQGTYGQGQTRLISLVRRTPTGGADMEQTISLETMSNRFDTNAPEGTWNYLDKSQTITLNPAIAALPAATLSEFSEESITIIADGIEYTGITIDTDGGLDAPPWGATLVTTLTVGFPYTSRLETLPVDVSTAGSDGPGSGATDLSLRRPTEIVVKVNNSADGVAGAVGTDGEAFVYPDSSARGQSADMRVLIDSEDDTKGSIFIESNSAGRLEISQIVTRTDYKAHGGND